LEKRNPMEIIIAEEKDQTIWDDLVKLSPCGTLFHTWKWLKIMERHNFIKNFSGTYHGQLYPLFVKMENKITGLIPIFLYKTPFLTMACSPAFGVENAYLGPILNDKLTLRSHRRQVIFYEFHNAMDNYLKNKLKVNYISIHSSPGLSDPRPYIWSDYTVVPDFTYFINLKAGRDSVWDGFSRTLKQDIKKVEKKGIHVEIGSKKDVEFIYELLKKRGRIPSNKEYILDIFDNFSHDNLIVFIAKYNNEPLSGVITICYKNKIGFWVGTPKFSYDGTNPNTLVYWETMKWAIDNGFENFEIIGASDLSYFMFKSKFNGELVPYYTTKWYSPRVKVVKSIQNLIKT
jgi:hypothetical protein